MRKGKIRTVTVNDRGQIVIPEEMRKDIGIQNNDTLVLIEREGEIVIKKESEIISVVDDDSFWRGVSQDALNRTWEKEDEVWDKLAKRSDKK